MSGKRSRDPHAFEYELEGPLTDEQVRRAVDRFMHQIGARMAELRQMRGFTQKQICDEHDFNPSQVSRLEAGKMNMTLRTACRYAAALGVRPWELYVPRDKSSLELSPREHTAPKPTDAQLDEAALQFRKQLGTRVRELRSLQGLTPLAVSTLTGMDVGTFKRLESGGYNIRASTAIRLADAIGVHPYELYIPREQSGIRLKGS